MRKSGLDAAGASQERCRLRDGKDVATEEGPPGGAWQIGYEDFNVPDEQCDHATLCLERR